MPDGLRLPPGQSWEARRIPIVALAAIVVFQFQVQAAAQGPPVRDGGTSPVVRYAYFTKDTPALHGRIREGDLPRSYQEFEAAVDSRVVFVAVLNRTGDFKIRGVLRDGANREHDVFERQARSDGGNWSLVWREYGMRRLHGHPGTWTVQLFVDDHHVGSFPFTVRIGR